MASVCLGLRAHPLVLGSPSSCARASMFCVKLKALHPCCLKIAELLYSRSNGGYRSMRKPRVEHVGLPVTSSQAIVDR